MTFHIPFFNHTFYGITKVWTPRFGKTSLILCLAIPTAFTFIVWVVAMIKMGKTLRRQWRDCLNNVLFRLTRGDDWWDEECKRIERECLQGVQEFKSNHHEHLLVKKIDYRKCDICKYSESSLTWYHCGECGFDLCTICVFKEQRKRNIEEGQSDDIPLTPNTKPEATSSLLSITTTKRCSIPPVIKRGITKFRVFVSTFMPLIKITWDAVDVFLDVYIFYDVESGGVLDKAITRNTMVNNAILVFAIVGALKMVFTIWMFDKIFDLDWYDPDTLTDYKAGSYMLVYLLEDCGELFLEYFFLEKYLVNRPQLYMIVKDEVILVIAIIAIVGDLYILHSQLKRYMKRPYAILRVIMMFGSTVIIGTVNFFRVGGAIYQYVTGRLHPECLQVVDGALIQSAFSSGCLREIDYVILSLMFIPVVFFFVLERPF